MHQKTIQSDDALLTTWEVAAPLRIKEPRIDDLIVRNARPFRRVRDKLLCPRLEIDQWSKRGGRAAGDGGDRVPVLAASRCGRATIRCSSGCCGNGGPEPRHSLTVRSTAWNGRPRGECIAAGLHIPDGSCLDHGFLQCRRAWVRAHRPPHCTLPTCRAIRLMPVGSCCRSRRRRVITAASGSIATAMSKELA